MLSILVSTVPPTAFAEEKTPAPTYSEYRAQRYKNEFSVFFGDSSDSLAHNYYYELSSSASFMSSVAAWEVLHMVDSPSYAIELGLITRQELYTYALFDLFSVSQEGFGKEFFETFDKEMDSYVVTMADNLLEADLDTESLKNTKLTKDLQQTVIDKVRDSGLLKAADASITILDGMITVGEALSICARYETISNMKDGTLEILDAIANDPSNEYALRAAAKDCKDYFGDSFDDALANIETFSKKSGMLIFDYVIDKTWDNILKASPIELQIFVLGVKGMRVFANAAFDMDDKIQAYYKLSCIVAIEDSVRRMLNSHTAEDPELYISIVDAYKRSVILGFDYSAEIIKIQMNAPGTQVFNFLTNDYNECRNLIDRIENSKKTRLDLYESFEKRVHKDYVELYCPDYYDFLRKLHETSYVPAESVALSQIAELHIYDVGYIFKYIEAIPTPDYAYFFEGGYNVTSENEDILFVDDLGYFEARGYGECTIVFDKGGDLECSITVDISSEPSEGADFSNDFEYNVTDYGTIEITYYIGDAESVYIPYYIEGLEVTEIASGAFQNNRDVKRVSIPDSVKVIRNGAFYGCTGLADIAIGKGVEIIEDSAFKKCTALCSIVIPDNVVSIGEDVLYECDALEKVTLPYTGADLYGLSDTHFSYIFGSPGESYSDSYVPESLREITITKSEYIPDYAFQNCVNVEKINLGNKVKNIGTGAFFGCESLASFTVSNSITELGEDVFRYCTGLKKVTIGSGLTTLRDSLFEGCTSLSKVTIGKNVRSIGKYVFMGCESLKSVTIPNSVTAIDPDAFSGCTALSEVVIGDGLSAIPDEMFYEFTSLKSVTLGKGVKSIGEYAFCGCTSLKTVNIPDGVESIGKWAFESCESIVEITIPDSVTVIGENAFAGCTSLTEFSMGKGVTEISEWMLRGCKSLTTFTVTADLTAIGKYAFAECTSLVYVDLPDSVETILSGAFNGSGLTSITLGASLTNIESRAFASCSGLYKIFNRSSLALDFGSSANGGVAQYAKIIEESDGSLRYNNTSSAEYVELDGGLLFEKTGDDYSLIAYVGRDDTVTLPATVDGHAYSINKLYGILHVVIPAGISDISANSFGNTTVSITVDKDNPYYSSVDGILYSKDGKALLRYPSGKQGDTFTVPAAVERIGGYAFASCNRLENVLLGDGVIIIDDSAFLLTNIPYTVYEDIKYVGTASNPYHAAVEVVDTYKDEYTLHPNTVAIAGRLFSYNTSIESVELPLGLVSIGDYAFWNASSLDSVSIPDTVTYIGEAAFWGCDALSDVDFGRGVAYIGARAFYSCSEITKISLPDTLTYIGSEAFRGCERITYIELPDSVVTVCDSAFYYCRGLTSIVLGSGLESVGTDAFGSCSSLYKVTNNSSLALELGSTDHGSVAKNAKIIVNNDGTTQAYKSSYEEYFELDGGFLFKKYFSAYKLVAYVGRDSAVTLPSSCNGDAYTFNTYMRGFTDVTVPDGVSAINDYAFSSCNTLTRISLPATVTSIGTRAFYGCDNLSTVVYRGTEEEWSSVTVGSSNTPFTSAELYFDAHVHSYGEWQRYDDVSHVKYCECADAVFEDHSWDDGVTVAEPTHTTYGTHRYSCTACGASKDTQIDKLPTHEYGGWENFDAERHIGVCDCGDTVYELHSWDEGRVLIPPTDTEDGVSVFVCIYCAASREESIPYPTTLIFEDAVLRASGATSLESEYVAITEALFIYADMTDEERAEVSDAYRVLVLLVEAYNTKVDEANTELSDATELLLSPLAGCFVFISAFWLLLKKYLGFI